MNKPKYCSTSAKIIIIIIKEWITVDKTSTIEKENSGSNGRVNIKEKQKKKDTCWKVLFTNTNPSLFTKIPIWLYFFLAKQFVFTLLKPITLDSYFKNNYKKKRQKIQQIIVVWKQLMKISV